jgi:hypothetical protein
MDGEDMGITINQTYAKIGIDTTQSGWQIKSTPSKLELHQEQASISLKTEKPRILIDQYECFASSGLKNDRDLILEAKNKAYQKVMSFIQKTAEDGKMLRAIEKSTNVIASLARRDQFSNNQFGIAAMPAVGPDFTFVRGTVNMDVTSTNNGLNPSVEGSYNAGQINMQYTPSDVNIYLLQKPAIEIDFMDER